MGGAISGLAFLPPPRTSTELRGLRQDPRFVLVNGHFQSEELWPCKAPCSSGSTMKSKALPVSALHVDRGAPVTILYSHANAEDLLDVHDGLVKLSEMLNVNVLGYDYYGYGSTGGTCSEEACCLAARASLRYLLDQGVDKSSIVLMGRSLGTGPTIDLAIYEPCVAGVVLQSPLLSVLRTRLSENFARVMHGADLFDNTQKIREVLCPVFVIHGTEDNIVSRDHGEEICRQAPNAIRPWWVEGSGHNDLPGDPDYYNKLTEFLSFVKARQKRQWGETVASYASKMIVIKTPSNTKLLLNAM